MAWKFTPSDDPNTAPHAAGGWSGSLRVVDQATIAHVNQGYLVHPSGVFDADRVYVPQAVHWRGRALMTPPPFPEEAEPLAGRWLWGGVLMDHFGHFIMESLGRLWGLDHEKVDGILFIPESGFSSGPSPELKPWQRLFLRLLQTDLPVRIVTRPTRVETLVVPGQGFGIGPLIGGAAHFRHFVQTRFAKDIAPQGGDKLYISRSRLDADLGGIVLESRLEAQLQDHGYEAFHPQEHGLEAQIARYKAAKQVISIDGSALHLFALVAGPDQRVAVIKRRPGSAPDGIVDHLAGFTGQSPVVLDAIQRHWMRSDRRFADNMSYGEVDFQLLGEKLAEHGFLAPDQALTGFSAPEVGDFIAGLEGQMPKKGLYFRPIGLDHPKPAKKERGQRKRDIVAEGQAKATKGKKIKIRAKPDATKPVNPRRLAREARRAAENAGG
ncbi:glycosyltransferase family 61 protein [Stagnihabitans tardus]|uniref:DUF563 domain-containing protein n=1 Tax=Stagnihabitans tardus TaxID=2699202 RepID=A0AAE4YCG9_9RHOB|nr:glycosyltransferase 61 family protein [Stagnihabitans tardus]NBZ87415.1 DUF563 domain-containing protein [Stagnihabitans tardus]